VPTRPVVSTSEVAGGDSNSASREGAAADEAAASTYERRLTATLTDPGDRTIEREAGDPWEPSLSEDQRARRIEGRKVHTHKLNAGEFFDSMYRVDRWVRFLPQRGSDGLGLAQFWGPQAKRRYKAEDLNHQPDWEVITSRKLHTVNVGDIIFMDSASGSPELHAHQRKLVEASQKREAKKLKIKVRR
jgi:hypothetical protein